VETLIHERVNEIRTRNGTSALGHNETVASVSRAHSEDMDDRSYFDHVNPDGEYPWDRYDDVAGGTCRTYGENIAMNWIGRRVQTSDGIEVYDTNEEVADAIVDQWMNSSGHRQNILADQWDREGLGVYITSDGQVFATQNFCG
jgi:uncharacterized protein YkwD